MERDLRESADELVTAYHIYTTPPSRRYRTFTVPKRSGAPRVISAPDTALAILQRKLATVLSQMFRPRRSVHGFVRDRGVHTNAAPHVRARFVLNVDLADFFPSINFGRVRGMFMAAPFSVPAAAATVLAQICCHNNQLPQGAPTSPIVSNMICPRLDRDLERLARSFRCRYTRYADDITISTYRSDFPVEIARRSGTGTIEVGPALAATIDSNGFSLNLAKLHLRTRVQRQEVTGLTTNVKVNVRRRFVRQIRAMLHAWQKFGIDGAQAEFESRYDRRHRCDGGHPRFSAVLRGKLAYLSMVRGSDDRLFRSLLRRYCDLDPDAVFPYEAIACANPQIGEALPSIWVIESMSDEGSAQGSAFWLEGVGLVTCAHCVGHSREVFPSDARHMRTFAEVVAIDDEVDLAVLRPTGGAPVPRALRRGSSGGLRVMDRVYVCGFPNHHFGDTPQVRDSAMSGRRGEGKKARVLLTTGVVFGCSGGPVVDERGVVLGVAVTGAERVEVIDDTEKHGMVPIESIDLLPKT